MIPPELRLHSPDCRSWLELSPLSDDQGYYTAVSMEAVVDIGHGRFTAFNGDVQLLGIAAFCDVFDKFILDRTLQPCLEGTYDSFIAFSGSSTSVVLSFCVGDSYCGSEGVEDYRLRGKFAIDQGLLNDLLAYFCSLSKFFGR